MHSRLLSGENAAGIDEFTDLLTNHMTKARGDVMIGDGPGKWVGVQGIVSGGMNAVSIAF